MEVVLQSEKIGGIVPLSHASRICRSAFDYRQLPRTTDGRSAATSSSFRMTMWGQSGPVPEAALCANSLKSHHSAPGFAT